MIRPRLSGLCAAVLALAGASAHAAAPLVHTVTIEGQLAGEERLVVQADGTLHNDFKFSNNGRGPDIHEDMRFAPDGSLLRYVVQGRSTFGAPVAERFERTATGARWKSLAESEEASATLAAKDGERVYVPVETGAEFTAAIARQLLRHPAKPVAGWSGGALSARVLATTTVAGKVAVDLVAIIGLDLEPSYIWLRHDAGRAYFATVAPDFNETEKGFEATAPTLLERQETEDKRERARLAQSLSHRVGDEFVIRDVRVFDAEHARLGDASDVYVSRGRIALVLPAGSTARGDDIASIDGHGRTLLPGLFDMHVHDDPWSGIKHLAAGITTGRDMGNDNHALRTLSNDIDRGANLGERIVAAGFIEGKSPYSALTGFVVDSQEEGLAKIDWYAQHGFRQIKLYNSIHPEWVPAFTAHAHALGLRVSGHVPAFMHAEDAVRAGYDEIQHINQVTLNFLTGPKDDTRTLLRFDLVAQKANQIDLDSPEVARFIALLKEHGTAIDTTAAVFEPGFTQLQGEIDPGYATIAGHLPPVLRRALHVNSSDVTPANVAGYRASFDTMLRLIKKMYDAGIPLEAGTDAIPGFVLHRELELYVKAGIPPAEALRIATWNGARFTNTLDRLGSVTPGKLADLVLVDGDPTTHIEDVRHVAMVVKEGTIYFPAELYRAIGVEPFAQSPEIRMPAAKAAIAGAGAGARPGRRFGSHDE